MKHERHNGGRFFVLSQLVKQSKKYGNLANLSEHKFQELVTAIAESIEPIVDQYLGLQESQWERYNKPRSYDS